MKTLKLPFCHPVHGKASFCHEDGKIISFRDLDSNENYEVEISLADIAPGKWKVIFEWEQNGEQFSLNKNIIIDKS